MSFYLRKAFSWGPIRLNLSRAGLGLSLGVRGARIGLTPGGRAYTHVGRYGIYSRTYLGTKDRDAGAEAAPPGGEPVILEEETDVTFTPGVTNGTGSIPPPLEERMARPTLSYAPLLLAALLLFALGDVLAGPGSTARDILRGLSLIAFLAWPAFTIPSSLRNRRGRQLGRRLETALAGPALPTGADRESIEAALRDPSIDAADREYRCRLAYLGLLRRIIEDRVVTGAESRRLVEAERLLSIDPGFAGEARLQIYREVYLEAVADHELTPGEEATLDQIRERLEIPRTEITAELETVEQLAELRAIRAGALPEVDPGVPLRRSETCHFTAEGRIIRPRIMRSFQREGRKYKIRGWVIDREGRLLITNRRILLIHEGTSSIPMNRILDLEVDCDRNLITITRDGAKRPVYLTTPDAPRAAAIIAGAAGM